MKIRQEARQVRAPAAVTDPRPDDPAEPAVGPIFISGRQHSGNTVTTCVFAMVPDCYAVNVEGRFFEQLGRVERIGDPARQARCLVDLLRLEPAVAEPTRQWLVRWHLVHPDAAAVDLYRRCMAFATALRGKRFWVQRATSYVFYAREILRLMPEARMLYLLRNPYDVCASLKRRAPKLDRFWGWVLSWNRGLRIAEKMQQEHPERFLIVRYEEMANRPLETFRRIFQFAGVPFDARYLDVPHVNRSEAVQARTSETTGLNPSRVFYYTGILDPAEVAAVDMLVWERKVRELYPDLPHLGGRRGLGTRLGALRVLAISPFAFLLHQVWLLGRHDPGWRLRRLLKRVGIVLRSG